MRKSDRPETLEEMILTLQKMAAHDSISIGDVLRVLSGKGRFLILILLSLPFCQPIQIPGLSTFFGLGIAFMGLRMAFGKRVWIPKGILAKEIAPGFLQKMTTKALGLTRRMKRWIHPRYDWICHYPLMRLVNGLIISVLGIFLALPLPIPLSNLLAAWSICLIALGLLEDDGVFVLIGYGISLLTCVFFVIMILTINRVL